MQPKTNSAFQADIEARAEARREDRPHGDAHGGLRDAYGLHLQKRTSPGTPVRGEARERPRLPGVRLYPRVHRRVHRACRARGGNGRDIRRHASRAGDERVLAEARAAGGGVLVVYSALDAVRYAAEHRDRKVVFVAVGFETTAPATAVAVQDGRRGAHRELLGAILPQADHPGDDGASGGAGSFYRRVYMPRARVGHNRPGGLRAYRRKRAPVRHIGLRGGRRRPRRAG